MALPSLVFCQADSLDKPVEASSSSNVSEAAINSLYTGIGAGSNMIYLGTSISNNKPFYSVSLTYGFRNSLFISASASHLSETNPFTAFCNLALNYSHAFNSWFDVSADLAAYKTARSLQDSLFSDFALMSLTAGFDWKLIYTRLSFSEIISDENGFYLQISNSRYFETPPLLKGKGLVSLDPSVDILFGNLISVKTVNGTRTYGKSPAISYAKRKQSGYSEAGSESFGLIDFGFSLPVTFSYGNFSLEAEASYLLPVYSDPYYPDTEGFTFYLNAIFKIF